MTDVLTERVNEPVSDRQRKKQEQARLGSNRLAHVVLTLGSLVMMFPFLWQLKMSISTQAEITSVPPDVLPGGLE